MSKCLQFESPKYLHQDSFKEKFAKTTVAKTKKYLNIYSLRVHNIYNRPVLKKKNCQDRKMSKYLQYESPKYLLRPLRQKKFAKL